MNLHFNFDPHYVLNPQSNLSTTGNRTRKCELDPLFWMRRRYGHKTHGRQIRPKFLTKVRQNAAKNKERMNSFVLEDPVDYLEYFFELDINLSQDFPYEEWADEHDFFKGKWLQSQVSKWVEGV